MLLYFDIKSARLNLN